MAQSSFAIMAPASADDRLSVHRFPFVKSESCIHACSLLFCDCLLPPLVVPLILNSGSFCKIPNFGYIEGDYMLILNSSNFAKLPSFGYNSKITHFWAFGAGEFCGSNILILVILTHKRGGHVSQIMSISRFFGRRVLWVK